MRTSLARAALLVLLAWSIHAPGRLTPGGPARDGPGPCLAPHIPPAIQAAADPSGTLPAFDQGSGLEGEDDDDDDRQARDGTAGPSDSHRHSAAPPLARIMARLRPSIAVTRLRC